MGGDRSQCRLDINARTPRARTLRPNAARVCEPKWPGRVPAPLRSGAAVTPGSERAGDPAGGRATPRAGGWAIGRAGGPR
ncbi:unnamed protein product [Lampetra fluviatilis]